MRITTRWVRRWFVTISLILLVGCMKPEKEGDFVVKMAWANEPISLNPYLSRDANSRIVQRYLFQPLLSYDFQTLSLTPVLAEGLPVIDTLNDSIVKLTFQIRNEARWDNGKPVTATDVLFSMKAIICPGVEASMVRSNLASITHFITYPDDEHRFSLHCKRTDPNLTANIGTQISILPQYYYDSAQVLKKYEFSQLQRVGNMEEDLLYFSRAFNANHSRDPDQISGSGSYRIISWKRGEYLRMEKKQDWWGALVDELESPFLQANPDELVIQISTNWVATIQALQSGDIDIVHSVPPPVYKNLISSRDTSITKVRQVPILGYTYIGLNLTNPNLQQKKIRQTLAMLVDYDRIMEDVLYGGGERIVGPIHPILKRFYNREIEPHRYLPDSALSLLKSVNLSQDVMEMNGPVSKGGNLELNLLYVQGNEVSERIALIFQYECAKVGIRINLVKYEFSTFMEALQSRDFDLYISSWSQEIPVIPNLKEIFHSTSIDDGSNFVSYSNPLVDKRLDSISMGLYRDSMLTIALLEIQDTLHEEVPYIFLYTPLNRIAYKARLKNLNFSTIYPGYWPPAIEH